MSVHPSQALRASDRTVAVVPACEHIAGRERFMHKALALQAESSVAFDVTLDLEDGAPIGQETQQAELVTQLLRQLPAESPRRVGVRVHDILHPHFMDDLRIVLEAAGDRVAYIVLPKAKDRGDVEYFSSVLQEMAKAQGRPNWRLHVLIESQRALRDVFSIASHPDVESLDFGSMDFISDHLGAIPVEGMSSPVQFEHALLQRAKTNIVAASLLHGVVPTHNVTIAVDDPEQAGRDAARARREYGFLRMWSIHPAQIEPIVRAMSPTEDETTRAAQMLIEGQDADWAPIRFQGTLQDRASYRYAWAVLQRARLSSRPLPEEAVQRFFSP